MRRRTPAVGPASAQRSARTVDQSGAGTRKGKSGARQNTKDDWKARIRAQRARLKELRDEEDVLDASEYRTLYNKSSGGEFEDVARLEAYIQTQYGYEVTD